jgi:electron transport complex protein RnfD
MWTVNAALLPTGAISIYIFGLSALWVVLVSIASALFTEALIQKVRRKTVTISDGTAFMTGLLLAYTLPARCPLGVVACGSIFAIAVGKQAFGGFGKNLFNPALAGRAFLMFLWPKSLSVFTRPFVYDAVTQATPLSLLKEGRARHLIDMGLGYWDLFFGNRSGCIGEVCIFALLLAGLYLLYKRIITWHIPASFILTVGIFMWIFGAPAEGFFKGDFLLHIFSGGLALGAIFMATDYVTSPTAKRGQLIFGVGCGFLTSLVRLWGAYAEGVCYAILLMNALVPLIDRRAGDRRRVDNSAPIHYTI